jgi:hypothetical protein
MTQELLALVTGLAHYLKILIRIALTGALKLEREHGVREAMQSFLDKLHLLAVQGGNPSVRRMIKGAKGEVISSSQRSVSGNAGTNGVTYGFRSLAPENAGESPFLLGVPRDPGLSGVPVVNPPSDLCVQCTLTVEEDCVRLGTYQRWHSHCIQCKSCGKVAAPPVAATAEEKAKEKEKAEDGSVAPKITTARRPPANVDIFAYELDSIVDTQSFGAVPTAIYCTDHAHQGCRGGFQAVSRLEQYAFLLNVALRRLYLLLKKRKVIPLTPSMCFVHSVMMLGTNRPPPTFAAAASPTSAEAEHDPYRSSQEIMRMKTVHLDRKLSATAHLPKRSTIIESPSGKVAHPSSDVFTSPGQGSGRTQSQALTREVDSGLASQGQRPPPTTQQNVPGASAGPLRPQRPPQAQGQQQPPSQSQQHAPPVRPSRPTLNPAPPAPSSADSRPNYVRKNSEVKIVDESAPSSPSATVPSEGGPLDSVPTLEGLTLADIPQFAEAAQAMEQRRSLPRQSMVPYVAELTPLELAIVRHTAVAVLCRSPLRDQVDLDEILEMVEAKKQGFWGKLFKGNDKKYIKKKGALSCPSMRLVRLMVGSRPLWCTAGTACRTRGCRLIAWRVKGHTESAKLYRRRDLSDATNGCVHISTPPFPSYERLLDRRYVGRRYI